MTLSRDGGRPPERPGDLIEATRRVYRDVFGTEPRLESDFAPALEALLEGAEDIVVEMPWHEIQKGERVERHQVVLKGLEEDNTRVLFHNPAARRDLAVGTELGRSADEGPPRRVEPEGLESMDLTDLARCFAEGRATALIPPTF